MVITALSERGEKAIMAELREGFQGAAGPHSPPRGVCSSSCALGISAWLVTLYFSLQFKCALKGENQQGAFQEWQGNYKIQEAIENWYKAFSLYKLPSSQ